MEKKANNLETIFQNTFKQHTEAPSSKVLRHLKYRLSVSEFFSFKPNKPNIVYTAILTGAIVTGLLFLKEHTSTSEINDIQSPSQKMNDKSANTKTQEEEQDTEYAINKSNKNMLSAYFNVTNIKGCAPLEVKFNNRSTRANTYHWNFGNGDGSNQQNPSYTYSQPGLYQAKLTIKNDEGQSDIYSREIQVFETPVADVMIDIENSEIESKEVLFINKSKGSSSYIWNFGDSKITTAANPSHTYENYGVYHVKLIAASKDGCYDTIQLENKFLKNNYQLIFPYTFKPNTTDKGNNGFYERNGAQGSVFYPKNYGAKEYHFSIMASNGIEVFSTNNIKQGWNGYIRGRVAPGGVYSYIANGVYPNGKSFHIKGRVKVMIEDYFQD